jgi:hypothetical protein
MVPVRTLKAQLRVLENDLSSQQIELMQRMKAAAETEQQVEFLKEQIVLIQSQLDRCK